MSDDDGSFPYVVRQGESLATIAARHSFDPDDIWQLPANSALRKARTDPHVLAPGDVLVVPAPKPTWLPAKVGSTNTYVGTVPSVHASIRCTKSDGAPIAHEAYSVEDVSPPLSGTTDANGVVTLSFSADLDAVTISFPRLKLVVVAKVAHLDPLDTPSGLAQRLAALGLFSAPPAMADSRAQTEVLAEFVAACLKRFQQSQGLDETGELDDATRQALEKAHGA